MEKRILPSPAQSMGSKTMTLSRLHTAQRPPASPIGSYPITPTLNDPAGRQANYVVTLQPGLLTVKAGSDIRIVSITPIGDQIHISGSGDANITYYLQTSEDLVHWTDLRTVQADSTGAFAFDDSLA